MALKQHFAWINFVVFVAGSFFFSFLLLALFSTRFDLADARARPLTRKVFKLNSVSSCCVHLPCNIAQICWENCWEIHWIVFLVSLPFAAPALVLRKLTAVLQIAFCVLYIQQIFFPRSLCRFLIVSYLFAFCSDDVQYVGMWGTLECPHTGHRHISPSLYFCFFLGAADFFFRFWTRIDNAMPKSKSIIHIFSVAGSEIYFDRIFSRCFSRFCASYSIAVHVHAIRINLFESFNWIFSK